MPTTIKASDKLLLAAKTPCSLTTVEKLLRGGSVRPLIGTRIREVARELDIALPAPRAPKAGAK
jgi:hypothetical protein